MLSWDVVGYIRLKIGEWDWLKGRISQRACYQKQRFIRLLETEKRNVKGVHKSSLGRIGYEDSCVRSDV